LALETVSCAAGSPAPSFYWSLDKAFGQTVVVTSVGMSARAGWGIPIAGGTMTVTIDWHHQEIRLRQ
jgi:hypothetical protein